MTYKMKITETDSEQCVLSCVCFSSVSFDADLSPRPVPKTKKKKKKKSQRKRRRHRSGKNIKYYFIYSSQCHAVQIDFHAVFNQYPTTAFNFHRVHE